MPITPLSPAERSLRARIAANVRWANEPDRLAATAPGRRAMLDAFERQVDPDGILCPEERAKRAKNARLAALQRAQLKASRRARQRREAVHDTGDVGPERGAVEPDGGQLEAQLLQIISDVTLSKKQLIRISELLRTSHQAGGGSSA
ncbi:MAG: hypothetical protein QJR12_01375 [Mycobacterium sp.]|uniref:hypothetical protein n=1 Tax=Mycobacterium sp. TaxID=1785 RepID=UPI00260715BB|nr:hypothetical protein [Mycobacterium sp.]MDI3312966.1 hypothetical protein [Mycobacterium sp.]